MDTFPNEIAFRLSWRPYQQRVLAELNEHLEDNHLHVIAAPGSGKTILGLEVSRILNQPTLIFAPTLAIRDQWVDRFVNFFYANHPDIPNWISKDIRRPKFLTVSTYQGLHSAYVGKRETEEEELRQKRAAEREKHAAQRPPAEEIEVPVTPAKEQKDQFELLLENLNRIHRRIPLY